MQITHSGGAFPQESADGKAVYYLADAGHGTYIGALCRTPIGGGQEHPLGITAVERAFQVVPDGIYFISTGSSDASALQIRFYDFATHHSRLIESLGHVNTFPSLSVSPDRKTFLYSVVQDGGHNLMLVDNFR